VKAYHLSWTGLAVAVGTLLIAWGHGDQNAIAASITGVILAFLPSVVSPAPKADCWTRREHLP
jgi:hypothetical protein